jgi:YidC/Oxa1 family membrane protein insertase
MLVTFRSTMSQQKMTALQPELAKIQAKYPNSNTNQAEKQKLAQEQMALYRRNKIHPMGQILVLIVQFPVFICVWSGLQGASTLSTGQVLNLRLSDNINSILMNFTGTWYANSTGWWTALVLFLLMAAVQVMAMVLPRIIQKRAQKNATKLSANPAQTDQQRQMKMVSIIMVGFTIVMGFMLPAAMGVYWLISGLLSMAQTFITQLIIHRKGGPKKSR